MASLADIPPLFLDIYRKDDFFRWLRDLQTDNMTKKELLFLWAEYIGYHVTSTDMIFVFGPDGGPGGI